MIKNLTNILCGIVAVVVVWRIFFFWVMPRLVDHYGATRKRQKEYEEKLRKIEEENVI